MVFSSPIFLFVFLPLVVAGTFLVPRRARNTVLLSASLLFYVWGAGAIIVLLLLSIVGNDLAMRRIAVGDESSRRRWVAAAIAGNLAILGYLEVHRFRVQQRRGSLRAARRGAASMGGRAAADWHLVLHVPGHVGGRGPVTRRGAADASSA